MAQSSRWLNDTLRATQGLDFTDNNGESRTVDECKNSRLGRGDESAKHSLAVGAASTHVASFQRCRWKVILKTQLRFTIVGFVAELKLKLKECRLQKWMV